MEKENNQKYELISLVAGTNNKTNKPFYGARVLFTTPYSADLIYVSLKREVYETLKLKCPKLVDISDNIKIDYIFNKYQPVWK